MTERHWAEPTTGDQRAPGIVSYIISLVVGIPTFFLMAFCVYNTLIVQVTAVLALMSAGGCALAFTGMRQQPRRFRTASLLLTLIPGVVLIAAVGIFIAFIAALVAGSGA